MATKTIYKQATDLEHMRNQTAMYLGGKKVIESREYVYNAKKDQIELQTKRLTPAALKCFDEILVNAVDHSKGDIKVWFDSDGTITVENTKSYINVYETETRDGRKMWSPQMIFGEFKTSSNFDIDAESVTGGVFGTGAKGVNAFSKTFELETTDVESKINYFQVWSDCMTNVSAPEIEHFKDVRESFVRVTFLLNYADFAMTNKAGELKPELFADFRELCYMRVLHTAAFCGRRLNVHWNDTRVNIDSTEALLRKYLKAYYEDTEPQLVSFTMRNNRQREWNVSLATKENKENLEQVSIVNGIYVKEGTHLEVIENQIVEYVKPLWMELKDPKVKSKKVKELSKAKEELKAKREAAKAAGDKEAKKKLAAEAKELKEAESKVKKGPAFDRRCVTKYLFIMMTGYINRPSFTGQRKDKIDTPQADFAEYVIPEYKLKQFWDMLKPWLEIELFTKEIDKEKAASKMRNKRLKVKKYKPAKWAGGTRNMDCALWIAEGDSAYGTIDKGIACQRELLGYDRNGIFSIQGVPPNARKQITIKYNPRTGEPILIRSPMLQDNERLTSLVAVLGLEYSKTYESDYERRELSYGCVVLSADQDEDGKGNIRSQLFNFFWTFWPNLIRAGFVKFLITPIVRAFHKKGKLAIREFYTEKDYKASGLDSHEWDVIYYKGLGSHSDEEIRNMFGKVRKLIITFTADKKTENACEVYFGKDADLRKLILVKPPKGTEEDYYVKAPGKPITVSATDHLNTETRSFQRYNLNRHLKHAIDGGLPSKRKVWAGIREMRIQRNKVYQFTGEVTKRMNYHHGDASLNQAITHMAQCFPGANEFPMLLALSNFGSRKMGGKDAVSARYAYTKINKHLSDALFPPIDDYILDYTFDDGARGEPVFYVPVVPLAILENYTSPGHGWLCSTWARDYWQVSEWTRKCIVDGWSRRSEDFDFTKNRFRHDITIVKGVENSVGRYEMKNENTVVVTELPPRYWNEDFINFVMENENVVDTPDDDSSDTEIRIEIRFKPGYLKTVIAEHKDAKTDPIVKLLDLRQSLAPQLNMIGPDGSVHEFKSYVDVFDIWFPLRMEYYRKRITRMKIILRLRIMMYTEQLKFISKREELNLSGKKREAQNEILEREKFIKFNKSLLMNPSYTDIKELEDLVLHDPVDSTHEYLRKMDADHLSIEGEKEIRHEIELDEKKLKVLLEPKADQKMFLEELDALDKVVRKGQTEGWKAWETKMKWAEE